MKLRNLTSDVLTITVNEIVGDREFSLSIVPQGTVSLDGLYYIDKHKLLGKYLDIVREGEPTIIPEVEEIIEETPEIVEEEPEVEEIPDKFICELCGAEFASARGLSSHMSRVHSD